MFYKAASPDSGWLLDVVTLKEIYYNIYLIVAAEFWDKVGVEVILYVRSIIKFKSVCQTEVLHFRTENYHSRNKYLNCIRNVIVYDKIKKDVQLFCVALF